MFLGYVSGQKSLPIAIPHVELPRAQVHGLVGTLAGTWINGIGCRDCLIPYRGQVRSSAIPPTGDFNGQSEGTEVGQLAWQILDFSFRAEII